MNVMQAARGYLEKMASDVTGMKVLLLDAQTTAIISSFSTQTFLLSKEIYLVEKLDNKARSPLMFAKCLCFVRPTPESIANLMDELKSPKYGEYYLYFSNVIKNAQIEQIAECDHQEVVKEVSEFYCDSLVVNDNVFSLYMEAPQWPIYKGSLNEWDPATLQRTVEGLGALCLALKKRPIVRYAAFSGLAKRLGSELARYVNQEASQFDSRGVSNTMMLLVDRRSDPVTPLLTQWTYQAMVHELLGLKNGLVDLSHVQGIREDMRQLVLMPHEDLFYSTNLHANFGDLGFSIKDHLAELQKKTPNRANIESIADMKKFVDEYPQVRKFAGNVAKHVTLTSELSRLVEEFKLLQVSEIEQNLACTDRDQSDAITNILADPQISDDSKLKLVLLYALRNERSPNLNSFIQYFKTAGIHPIKIDLIENIIKYSRETGPNSPSGLASEATLDARVISLGKSVFKGLKGVENVYTQHTPSLHGVLEQLLRGRLRESQYPFLGTNGGYSEGSRVQEVIVFVIGGFTLEEERFAHQLMTSAPGVRIILGGNTIHNSQSFLKHIHDTFANRLQQ